MSEPDIDDVLAEYLDRTARGEPTTTQEYLARHPGLRRQLEAHFETLAELYALAVADPAYPVVDQQVGGHRLIRMLGRGGMGVVYLAERLHDRQVVALKVLGSALTQSRESLERFRRECAIAKRLSHANLIAVHDVFESQGYTFFTMEYVPGVTLAHVIQRMRQLRADGIPDPSLVRVVRELAGPGGAVREVPGEDRFASAARIVAALADALDHAHGSGVIHRDVKPQNVLIGADLCPKLGDFGLAKDTSLDALSRSGTRLGTAHYMSPEMVATTRVKVDHRTDIYSLGATLYELLTLDLPFLGDSVDEVFRRITFDDPPSLKRFDPRIPRPLQAIALKALEKNPDRRFASAGAMAEELRRYLRSEPIETRMPARVRRLYGAVRRRPRLLAAAAVVLVTAATAFVAPRIAEAQRRGDVLLAARAHVDAGRHDAALALLAPLAGSGDPEVAGLLRRARGDQTLDIVSPAAEGELRILSLPGEAVATVPLAERTRVHLPPGDHVLTARLPGDRIGERHVTVRRDAPLPPWTIVPVAASGPPPGMVMVPAGVYEIGYDPPPTGHLTFARPRRTVAVPAYYIDVNEVTNAEYRRFLDATGHPRTPWHGDRYPEDEAHHPVTGVRWSEARAFAEWAGKRLPTETEWEVAGRGQDARRYPWGDEFELAAPRAHVGPARLPGGRAAEVAGRTVPVDLPTGDVSPFGVRHLVGNVQEWVADPWLPREAGQNAAAPAEVATGLAPDCDRVVRGSSFFKAASSSACLLSERTTTRGDSTAPRYGFRCALSAPQ
jgi:formylglycine-generating enzyme required for sulfatase activity/tRNA A-37 threonylcarbamoyl transferase component Bud32